MVTVDARPNVENEVEEARNGHRRLSVKGRETENEANPTGQLGEKGARDQKEITRPLAEDKLHGIAH